MLNRRNVWEFEALKHWANLKVNLHENFIQVALGTLVGLTLRLSKLDLFLLTLTTPAFIS